MQKVNRKTEAKLVIATMFVVVCWAYSPIGIHLGLASYSPGQLALLRFIIASIFMGIVAIYQGVQVPKVKDIPLLFVLGFFAVALHHIALNFGQRGVSAGAASVLAQSTPIFTVIISRCVLKERINLWRWCCVFCGMIGALIVVIGDKGIGNISLNGLLILVAACSWSVYFILQKRYSQSYSTLTMVCYTVWTGTVVLLVFSPGLLDSMQASNFQVNFAVVILGIFPSALAYVAWAYVLSHTEVSKISIVLYLIPPTAMVMASFILGELPSILVVLGGGIVILSVLAMSLEKVCRHNVFVKSGHGKTR
ncbi:DMT family transporter [Marinomonas polaris]|uniref:DMT family transporter n=1 Tax=Marinomonas polaris TaxID=293552 RepID=UPI00351475C1